MINNISLYSIINLSIILFYVIFLFLAYKRGFLYEILNLLYTLIAIVISWFLSPIFANIIPLVKLEMPYSLLNIEPILNTIIYFVIFFIILRIIGMFILPIFKSLSKIPIFGSINKILGLLFGFINATLVIVLLSFLLNTPIIKDGNKIKENTIFKYVDILSSKAIDITLNNIDFDKLFKSIDKIDIEKYRDDFKKWFLSQGIIK